MARHYDEIAGETRRMDDTRYEDTSVPEDTDARWEPIPDDEWETANAPEEPFGSPVADDGLEPSRTIVRRRPVEAAPAATCKIRGRKRRVSRTLRESRASASGKLGAEGLPPALLAQRASARRGRVAALVMAACPRCSGW